MTAGAVQAGCSPDRIIGIRREEAAVAACLDMARAGDLVILTPTRIAEVWGQVLNYKPQFSASIEVPTTMTLEPPHG